jgi:glycosyltransferase involved in cell wall biosynthesis
VRALIVSNMLPDAAYPERGSFVRDQLAALRQIDGLDVELYEFAPGARELGRAAVELRRRHGGPSTFSRRPSAPPFDLVHAHFGLSAWPALAVPARVRALTVHGTDLRHPRTRLATAAVLPSIDLLGAVSAALVRDLPGTAARRRAQVLPCGVELGRFASLPRTEARRALGLDPDTPNLLFPADPARPEKRYDRAAALARGLGVELHSLGGVDPGEVNLWVNAANAVIVPSEREGFGLAVLEALACDVPVLATPVGVHEEALEDVEGTLCAPFDLGAWRRASTAHVEAADPRIEGRASAERFSTRAMAGRVFAAWQASLARSGQRSR